MSQPASSLHHSAASNPALQDMPTAATITHEIPFSFPWYVEEILLHEQKTTYFSFLSIASHLCRTKVVVVGPGSSALGGASVLIWVKCFCFSYCYRYVSSAFVFLFYLQFVETFVAFGTKRKKCFLQVGIIFAKKTLFSQIHCSLHMENICNSRKFLPWVQSCDEYAPYLAIYIYPTILSI